VGGENSASHINTAPAVSQQASKTFMMRLPAAFGTAVPHIIPSLLTRPPSGRRNGAIERGLITIIVVDDDGTADVVLIVDFASGSVSLLT
jgi:hypothetical protein